MQATLLDVFRLEVRRCAPVVACGVLRRVLAFFGVCEVLCDGVSTLDTIRQPVDAPTTADATSRASKSVFVGNLMEMLACFQWRFDETTVTCIQLLFTLLVDSDRDVYLYPLLQVLSQVCDCIPDSDWKSAVTSISQFTHRIIGQISDTRIQPWRISWMLVLRAYHGRVAHLCRSSATLHVHHMITPTLPLTDVATLMRTLTTHNLVSRNTPSQYQTLHLLQTLHMALTTTDIKTHKVRKFVT